MRGVLIGNSGQFVGQTIPLENGETSIGRTDSNTISIHDTSVSRQHCLIRCSAGRIEIRDLDSRNGTIVNGLRVQECELADGDAIEIGRISFVFRQRSDSEPAVSITHRVPDHSQLRATQTGVVPIGGEAATLLRVGEVLRIVQTLLLDPACRVRPQLEQHLFQLIFELIPSRQGALVLLEGGNPAPLAGHDCDAAQGPAAVPESVLNDVLASGSIVTGESDGSAWLACPLVLAGRVIGVLYVASGGRTRAYRDHETQMITVLCEMLALAVENARDLLSLRVENDRLRAGAGVNRNFMIGNSAVMAALQRSIAKVAPGNSTVLILGESGTGKELVARAIHRNSPRSARPFVAVNCAAIAESLLESEFFGHEKGAFTGAIAQRKGKFELADGGTVFLDEIAELAPSLQAKLLRVLQEHEFERVGGVRPVQVDIRVVAATNRDLEHGVRDGRFREDLFYRLNVVPLRIPPLRQRREDIPLLATWFVHKFSEETGRSVTGLSREARAILTSHDWPGNVRELQNVIERAVVMGSSEVITPDDLSDLLPDLELPAGRQEGGFHEVVRQTRRRLIATALEQAQNNIPEAARALKLHPNYLHRLITTLGLRDRAAGDE